MTHLREYTQFKYYFPPRAEVKIKPDNVTRYDTGAFLAQPKYNGSCAVLIVSPAGEHWLYNRHNQPLTLQHPIEYQYLNKAGGWMVLCGEYLNKNKLGEDGSPFNHKFIIWDILVHNSQYLIGSTFEDRHDLLTDTYGTSRMRATENGFTMMEHLYCTDVENVFLAPAYTDDFGGLYSSIIGTDLYEGLVIKRRTGRLEIGTRSTNNGLWQLKVRKPTNSYDF